MKLETSNQFSNTCSVIVRILKQKLYRDPSNYQITERRRTHAMASFSAGAGASVIIANKCGLCGTTTRQRNYQNPPTEAVLSFFKQFTPDATWQHYFCSKCTMRAQRRLERDQSSLLQGDVQRSVTSAAPHRTNSITLDSQPLAFSSQGPEQPEAPMVVLAGGAAKRRGEVALTTEDSSLSSDLGSVQTVAASEWDASNKNIAF